MATIPAPPTTILATSTGAPLALVGGLVAFVAGVSAVCASVVLPMSDHPRPGVVRAEADHAAPTPVGAGRAAAAIETDDRGTIQVDRHGAADPLAANRRPNPLGLDDWWPPAEPSMIPGAAGRRRDGTTLPPHVIELERTMRADIAAEWALGADIDVRRELAAMAAAAHKRSWRSAATWSVEHNRGTG